MKILQVVPYFYPAWSYGGPAKLVYDTSRYFASQGHTVQVYTSDAYDKERRMSSEKHIHIPNLQVHYFRNLHNTLAYIYNIFFTPGLFFPAIWQVRQVDVIHLHDFYTPQNAWISWLAWLYKKPYILSVHGCLEEKRLAQRSFFKRVYLSLFGRWMLRHASMVIATSKNEVVAYQEYLVPSQKIFRLGHGVDQKEFETAQSKLACRRYFGLKDRSVVVTFLGRIHKIKGLDLLVKAVARIKDQSIEFVIAGSDDGFLDELKKLIHTHHLSDRVHLWNTCYGEEKAQLFKASDIFIYPSYSEGFSLGILEALAAGLPLIITTGCHFEQVEKAKAGLIVEPKATALSQAIKKMATDNELRKNAAKNAKLLVSQHYSMDVIGDQLLTLYQKVAA